MRQRERDRLKVMAPVLEGRRTQPEASRLLKRSVRQARRIQRRLEAEGDAGVIHGLRGRRSNRAKEDSLRRRVLSRYRERYLGFGPTLAAVVVQRSSCGFHTGVSAADEGRENVGLTSE